MNGEPTSLRTTDANSVSTNQVKLDPIRPVGFFFGKAELGLELWTVISGISGLDD